MTLNHTRPRPYLILDQTPKQNNSHKRRRWIPGFLVGVLGILLSLASCRPQDEVVTESPRDVLYTSADTIRFDTVITTLWSPTRRLRIFNPNDQAVTISSISLGPNSPFELQMYVNGRPGNMQSDILLRGKDSLLILLNVNLRSTQAGLPFLLRDSIRIQTKGLSQAKIVQVEAWGQNAIFFDGDSITSSTTWADQERPYYIKNSFLVPEGKTLTIKEGVRVYSFESSNLLVLGKLLVQGTDAKPVIFTGTRQEARFDLQPNQWGAIAILGNSRGNRIEHAIIKNGLRGIQIGVPQTTNQPDCYISNCLIRAHQDWGICAFGGKVEAINNIILDASINAVGFYQGGDYTLIHNTIGYSNAFGFKRDYPALLVTDFYEYAQSQFSSGKLTFTMLNNLVYGSRSNEFSSLILFPSLGHQVFLPEGNAIRTDTNLSTLRPTNTILDRTFRFLDQDNGDFAYDSTKTPSGKARELATLGFLNTYPSLRKDFDGKPRNQSLLDPGALNAKAPKPR